MVNGSYGPGENGTRERETEKKPYISMSAYFISKAETTHTSGFSTFSFR